MRLIDFFPNSAISIKSSAKDWQQAIDFSMEALLNNDYVTEGYVDAIKQSTQINGPYYVLCPYVAMPHARPELGAIKTGLTLTLLKDEVHFGDDHQPVRLLIGLAAIDPDAHIGVIQILSELLSEEESLQALLDAQSEQQLVDILTSSEFQ
ncbi:PTS mannitol transporter subunit IIA [Providencia burhodogranariea]|uniref:Putative PTS system mannitol-specific transporter subunit IIA n=1 Tax=Providencia burhodogranariea DSM 19968 TaxID=1141662 RepID=K8WGP0_9GAMM|nr:PTS mannitol transporter subunit IIA [Providencia burhodogranariea]EKT55370.1 putative PTS system mannitol-specific transporter subunit IIA [Providencia burhodogranariea DSM 19968]